MTRNKSRAEINWTERKVTQITEIKNARGRRDEERRAEDIKLTINTNIRDILREEGHSQITDRENEGDTN